MAVSLAELLTPEAVGCLRGLTVEGSEVTLRFDRDLPIPSVGWDQARVEDALAMLAGKAGWQGGSVDEAVEAVRQALLEREGLILLAGFFRRKLAELCPDV